MGVLLMYLTMCAVQHELSAPAQEVGEVAPPVSAEPEKIWALRDCLAYALENSPRLAAEQHRLAGAEEAVNEAAAADDVRIGLEGSGFLQGPELSIRLPEGPPVVVKPPRQGSLSLRLALPLDINRRLRHTRQSTRLSAAAQAERYRQALQQLILDVTTAYYRVLAAEAAVAGAAEGLRRAEGDLRTVQAQQAAGVATAAQVSASEAALAAAEQRVAETGGSLTDSRAWLATAIGVPADDCPELLDESLSLSADLTWEQARDVALAQRPELTALALSAQALGASADAVQASLQPSLTLMSSEALLEPPTGFAARESWQVGLAFSWPVGDSSRVEAQARGIEESREATLEELAAARLGVESEVQRAITRLAVLEKRLAADEAGLAEAQVRLGQAQVRHDAGTASAHEVVRAEAARAAALATLRCDRCEHSIALAAWARALGILDRLLISEASAELGGEAPR